METGDTLLDLNEGGVASLLSSLGFPFYESQIKEHGITGEVLVHLDHEALKDVGIHSVGQRLAILKSVYSLKIQQNIPTEEGHYVPPSDDMELSLADVSIGSTIPAQQLLGMLGERDDRIRNLEVEVQRLNELFMTLRDDSPLRPSVKTRTLPTRSPTSTLFPHPLSNASTLSRSNSRSRPLGEDESPRSPMDFSRLFVEPGAAPERISADNTSHLIASEALTPTTPTAVLYSQQQQQQYQIQQSRMDETASTPLTKSLSNDSSHYLRTSNIASTSALPPAAPPVTVNRSPSGRSTKVNLNGSPAKDKSSLERSTSNSDNPYRSFRVTLEDPCHKVLPAALKKYKINDDWRQYALFICYGNTERCLSYDEKPLLLFQRLKEANANPVFMLRHIKDIKSPIAVASAKHAARREKRSPNAGVGLDKPPSVNRDGSSLVPAPFTKGTTRLHQAPVLLPVGKDRERMNGEEVEDDAVKEVPGYCISIYPYLAEREDEFDVAVGDSFSIISKTKGWWVVYRSPSALSPIANANQSRKSAWVPAGCLLEINVPPLSLADPSISPPPSNAAAIPIPPSHVISVSTTGIALMDYVKNGSDELAVAKGTALRILKRYNHWSYAIKEETGERGWLPSWYVNKSPVRTDIAVPTTPTLAPVPPPNDSKPAASSNSTVEKRPLLELDGIETGLAKSVFDVHF